MLSEFKQLLDFQVNNYFPISKEIKEKYYELKDINMIHFSKQKMNYNDAVDYIKNLSIGGGNWRLPKYKRVYAINTEFHGIIKAEEMLFELAENYCIDLSYLIRINETPVSSPLWTDAKSEIFPEEYIIKYFHKKNFKSYSEQSKSLSAYVVCVR